MAITSEFNGFSGGLNPKEPVGAEAEKLFFHGIFALLCNRPAEAFEFFSPLAKHNGAAAFNCALCFLMAKDYEHSLKFLQEAEVLLHTFENTKPKQPLPSALLQYEKEHNGYCSPMLPDVLKLSPGQALKQTLRVKADVLYALGQTEELKKLLLLLSPEGYENIEKMKKGNEVLDMDNSIIFLNACKNGQKGVVQALLKKGGIDLNKRDASGNTPLFYVCIKGARDIAKLLIAGDADVTMTNNKGLAPIHAVSQSGNKEIVSLLLEAGADINTTDNEGKTPLMYTLMENRTETAKFLIENGADTSIADNSGHKAIDYATANGLRDIISLLSDTNTTDNYGNTPLHQACQNGQAEVVRELVKSSDLDALTDGGETPLILACMTDNLLIAQILIEAGADVNKRLLNGSTALHYAAGQGNQFMVKALIDAESKIDEQNENGTTPLIAAAMEGRNDVVSMLVEAGANVNLADNAQHTALYYASERGFTEIVEILIIAGAEG